MSASTLHKLFCTCLVVLLALALVRGDDEADERNYEAIISGTSIKLEAEGIKKSSTSNDTVDKFSMEVEGLNSPIVGNRGIAEIDLAYKSVTNTTEKEIEFEILMLKIVEFVAPDNTTIYDNTSVVVSEYDTTTAGSKWNPAGWQAISKVEDGLLIKGFTLTTLDGVLTLTGWYSGDPTFAYGPNTVKIDVEIRNFPFTRNGTRLGLLVRAVSEVEIEHEDDDSDDNNDDGDDNDDDDSAPDGSLKMSPGAGNAFGEFGWAGGAQNADNKTYAVIGTAIQFATGDDEEIGYMLYFTFFTPPGEDIVWDPSVGIQYGSSSFPHLITVIVLGTLVGVVVVIAGIWLTYYILKKKRNVDYEYLDTIEES